MIRFATAEDYQWIYDLVSEVFPDYPSRLRDTLRAQIEAKQVIVETDEHSAASFVPNDDHLDILFNTLNPKYSDIKTSSSVLGTYLLYRYRLPFRSRWIKEDADAYWATKNDYIREHTVLLGEEEIEGRTYNVYEYTYGD